MVFITPHVRKSKLSEIPLLRVLRFSLQLFKTLLSSRATLPLSVAFSPVKNKTTVKVRVSTSFAGG